MWSDRVSNPGPLTYLSGALPTVLSGPAFSEKRLDVSSESAVQRIHLKHHILFSSKDTSKKLKCCLLQFLFGASGTVTSVFLQCIIMLKNKRRKDKRTLIVTGMFDFDIS